MNNIANTNQERFNNTYIIREVITDGYQVNNQINSFLPTDIPINSFPQFKTNIPAYFTENTKIGLGNKNCTQIFSDLVIDNNIIELRLDLEKILDSVYNYTICYIFKEGYGDYYSQDIFLLVPVRPQYVDELTCHCSLSLCSLL